VDEKWSGEAMKKGELFAAASLLLIWGLPTDAGI
jgi:hypothetical protein